MSSQNTVILGGARTAMAEFNGSFADVPEIELGAHAARHALQRAGISGDQVDHTVVGNAMQTESPPLSIAAATRHDAGGGLYTVHKHDDYWALPAG